MYHTKSHQEYGSVARSLPSGNTMMILPGGQRWQSSAVIRYYDFSSKVEPGPSVVHKLKSLREEEPPTEEPGVDSPDENDQRLAPPQVDAAAKTTLPSNVVDDGFDIQCVSTLKCIGNKERHSTSGFLPMDCRRSLRSTFNHRLQMLHPVCLPLGSC